MTGRFLERAQILTQQGRHTEALRELHSVLAQDPQNVQAHYLASHCYLEDDKLREAADHAARVIELAPEIDAGHYAMARVYLSQGKTKRALAAASEAVRISPEDPDNHALVSAAHASAARWSESLRAAAQGLALDPENSQCLNLRVAALTHLGRRDEVDESLGVALRRDPENATTHANMGWAALHRGDPARAHAAFREALRLDPTSDWARAGIVESLKARYPVYGIMLRYFLWMSRFPRRTQIGLILGGLFGIRFLNAIGRQVPETAPLVSVLSLSYVTFVLLSWLAVPFFNLLLLTHREGTHALSRRQRNDAVFFGVGLLFSMAGLVTMISLGMAEGDLWRLVGPLFLLLPWSIAAQARPVAPKVVATAYTLGVITLGALALFTPQFAGPYLLACVVSTWLGHLILR